MAKGNSMVKFRNTNTRKNLCPPMGASLPSENMPSLTIQLHFAISKMFHSLRITHYELRIRSLNPNFPTHTSLLPCPHYPQSHKPIAFRKPAVLAFGRVLRATYTGHGHAGNRRVGVGL